MKFGRCLTRVSPSKSETSLYRRSCIPVSDVPPSSKSLENSSREGEIAFIPSFDPPLLGLSATRDFFPNSADEKHF